MKTIKTRKAPGSDGIPAKVINTVVLEFPVVLLQCLPSNRHVFYGLEAADIVAIKKETPITSLLFRPLCMWHISGKLFDMLKQSRRRNDIVCARGFANNQYGFRTGRPCDREITRTAWYGSFNSQKVWLLLTIDVKCLEKCKFGGDFRRPKA